MATLKPPRSFAASYRPTTLSDLRRLVFLALDHAKEAGHFAEGEQLRVATINEIVCDMLSYDDELEDCGDCSCLEPFVLEWMKANND